LPFGVHWEVDQAVVIVESFIAVGVFILRLGFGVVLSQPSPRLALTGAMTRPGSFRVVFRGVCSWIKKTVRGLVKESSKNGRDAKQVGAAA
jgi:hypothetical protein